MRAGRRRATLEEGSRDCWRTPTGGQDAHMGGVAWSGHTVDEVVSQWQAIADRLWLLAAATEMHCAHRHPHVMNAMASLLCMFGMVSIAPMMLP